MEIYTNNARIRAQQALESARWMESGESAVGARFGPEIQHAGARDVLTSGFTSLQKERGSISYREGILATFGHYMSKTESASGPVVKVQQAVMQAIASQPLGTIGFVLARTFVDAGQAAGELELQCKVLSSGLAMVRELATNTGDGEKWVNRKETGALASRALEAAKGCQTFEALAKVYTDGLSQVARAETAPVGAPRGSAPGSGFQPLTFPTSGPAGDIKSAVEKTEYLSKFGDDLTFRARQGKIPDIVGRDKECQDVLAVLGHGIKRNVALLGEAGVGKTAIGEKLAKDSLDPNHPLHGKTIVNLDLNAMVAGTQYRGMFEERLQGVIKEASARPDVILMIDEMHNLVGAGTSKENGNDAANVLKPALARGDIQVIGCTTLAEYEESIAKDGALERRFQRVVVPEPKREDCLVILGARAKGLEKHHGMTIPADTLPLIYDLADKARPDRLFPDKALDLMDDACSRGRMAGETELTAERLKETATAWRSEGEGMAKYGRDITREAAEGRLDQIEGRDDVAHQVLRVLTRRKKCNPILVGAAGVGKTAIAEKLAMDSLQPGHPLHGRRMIELNMGNLVAGTTYRGEFEKRLKDIIRDAEANPGLILVVDEAHTLMGAGTAEGAPLDAANMLKPALASGRITLMGMTTLDEYRESIETDPALARRFAPILVDEPGAEVVETILTRLASKMQSHFQLSEPVSAAIIQTVCDAAEELPGQMPDKAITLLEDACGEARISGDPAVTEDHVKRVLQDMAESLAALSDSGKAF